MNDTLKIARIQARIAKKHDEHELMMSLVKNPVLQIIAGYLIIETLQKVQIGSTEQTVKFFGIPISSKSEPQYLISDKAGTVAEGAILVSVALQQLAPLAPYISQNLESVMSGIGGMAKLAPAVAAIA